MRTGDLLIWSLAGPICFILIVCSSLVYLYVHCCARRTQQDKQLY